MFLSSMHSPNAYLFRSVLVDIDLSSFQVGCTSVLSKLRPVIDPQLKVEPAAP